MQWKSIACLSVIMFVYVALGALIFKALEYKKYEPSSPSMNLTSLPVFTDFLARHPNVTSSELMAFVNSMISASESARQDAVTGEDNGWTYDNAFLFAITVVSTIGYGHITPHTWRGKLFCIFYALVGIPIVAALLAGLGSRLRRPLDRVHNARPWYRGNLVWDKRLKSMVMLTIGSTFMLCVPAVVFIFTEDWDYLTALYFSTITLTTIGFGDYVPATSNDAHGNRGVVYRLALCAWLLVGLAYVAMVLSEVSAMYFSDMEASDVKTDPEQSDCEKKARECNSSEDERGEERKKNIILD